jgi:hypothetical protein
MTTVARPPASQVPLAPLSVLADRAPAHSQAWPGPGWPGSARPADGVEIDIAGVYSLVLQSQCRAFLIL